MFGLVTFGKGGIPFPAGRFGATFMAALATDMVTFAFGSAFAFGATFMVAFCAAGAAVGFFMTTFTALGAIARALERKVGRRNSLRKPLRANIYGVDSWYLHVGDLTQTYTHEVVLTAQMRSTYTHDW